MTFLTRSKTPGKLTNTTVTESFLGRLVHQLGYRDQRHVYNAVLQHSATSGETSALSRQQPRPVVTLRRSRRS